MHGEFRADVTRDTFDPANAYVRVLMQQGRVTLDADWNEQTSILLHQLRTLVVDLVGPHAGFDDGFKLEESHHGTAGGAAPFDFWIAPGNYYVGGVRCSNDRWRRFSLQYPRSASSSTDPDVVALEASSYLVYLDAWERHITPLEDEGIREVALGGPDTSTRAQVVWRVRAVEWAPTAAADTAEAGRTEAERFITDNRPLLSAVTMRCRAGRLAPEPRYTGAENRLYRVEVHRGGAAWDGRRDRQGNPAGNAAGAATFKWSPANASVALPIRSLSKNVVQVTGPGADDRLTVRARDWVEVVDDRVIGRPDALWQVESVDPVARTVTLGQRNREEPPQLGDADRRYHPLLRRWEHGADSADAVDGGILLTERAGEDAGAWIALEDGIAIQFGGGRMYRAGDYWLIPARTAIADVLWPVERDDAGEIVSRNGRPVPAARPPHGVEHRCAPIGLVRFDRSGALDRYEDLRRLVQRLAT